MKKTTKRGHMIVVLLAVVMVLSLIPFLGDASVEAASCSHTWVTVTTKQPTCGSTGTYVTKCSKCGTGNPNGNGSIPATGKHNWSLTSTTNATCTANGSKKYTCTVCKQTKQETITKLGHNFAQVTTKQPTCGSTGTYVTKCTRCGTGSANGNGSIPATGKHNWSLTSTTNATCTANGSKNYTCTVCKQTKKETITKLGHSFSQVTTKQPTCGTAGTYETKCSRCGAASANGNGSIPATGNHKWDRSAATCTAAKKCTVCGTIGEAAKGHNWDRSAATCTEAKKCKTCGSVGEAAKGHAWNISSANCTTDKKCTRCGTVSQKALGHSYAQVTTKQPTCGATGTYESKCSRCGSGNPNGNGTIPATGNHKWEYTSTTNATCTADGYKLYTCSVCKQTKKETITKLGHSFSQVTTKQPTCGTAGTYETKCSRCGTASANGNGSIPATGKHNFVYTSTTNPTCTADGYKLYTCSVCKQTKKETIEKLGHSFSQVTTKQPTCGTAGTYETKCSRCGTASANGNGSIPATGKHNFVYTSTTNPTCTADGYKLYTCSVCKQTKKETITKLGHSFSQVTTKEPTCGAAGTYETQCSRCGTGSPNGNGTIAPTGLHTWVYTSTTEPTCTKDGYKLYTCSGCKQTKKVTLITPGHSFTQVITKQPSCGTAGTYETKCSRCGTGSANGNGYIPATEKHTWNVDEPTCSTERKCTECGKVDKPFLAHTCTWITVPAGSGYGKMEYVCSVCNKTTAELFISGLSSGAKPSAYIKVKADTPAVNKFLLPSFGIPVNYQLLGYSTQANATKKEYTTGTTVSIPADGKLYAVVVPREYTVVYHDIPYSSDGTESEVHKADVDFEIEHKYLDDEPFRWCRGWSKTKNASEPTFVYGKRYDYKLIISAQDLADSNLSNNTVHLYPVWGDKKFTVRYEWYTGAQEVTHDSVNDFLTKGEVEPPAMLNNCHFVGWATDYDSAYVFSNKNTIADVLPLMDNDDNTLYAIYGNHGDAPEYILDSQYENPVWIDGRNVSIFIRKDNIIQVLNEASSWGGKDDTTDGYPMLEQIRNALYFGGSGYCLSDVCNVLNSDIDEEGLKKIKDDTSGLLYLEIRILNTFDGVSLIEIYENHVAPRHDGGSWYNLDPVKNVMIISFDPYIDVDGKKVRQHELIQSIDDIAKKPPKWNDPKDLWNAFATTMEEVSYGNVKYNIEKENIHILDEFPKDTSGNSYQAAAYLQTLKDAINWMNEYNAKPGLKDEEKKGWAEYSGWIYFANNPDDFTFDYERYFERFNVYEMVNSGEIDEVWIFVGPMVGLKPHESMMTGKDAFWINGAPLVKKGQRNYATYGFNFERGLGEMLEDAGHRMERTMDRVFFGGNYPISEANYDGKTYDQLNDWEKFCACDFLTKGSIVAGVGNVHCGPNAKKDYNWNNSALVKSYCDNWYNYPDISGNYRWIDCSEWEGNITGHHKWWFSHIPHVNMVNESTGKYNNWWCYFNFCDLQ